MRCLLCLLLLCVYHFSYCQQKGKAFSFTGSVTNTLDGYVYFGYVDSANRYISDSSRLQNGQFSFTGYISSPLEVTLKGKTASRSVDDPRYTSFFLEPGNIQGVFPGNDFKKATIIGSKSQDEYSAYEKQLAQLDAKWKNVLDAFTALRSNVEVEKNRKLVDKEISFYRAERTQLSRRFIRQHPQSYVSANLMLGQMYQLSLDSLKIYYSRLAPLIQVSVEGRAIGEFIRKEESIAIGRPAPGFTQPDTGGRPVSLHDFKGQYVLLDIWASWCIPCREEHPYLRQAYARFKDKGFTILSLSMDEEKNKKAWLEAIQKDSLTWPQVCDFKVYQNKVVNDYNVLGKGIPASFLINPQGIIVAMNLRGKALEEELEKRLSSGPLNPSKGGAIKP